MAEDTVQPLAYQHRAHANHLVCAVAHPLFPPGQPLGQT